MAAFSYQNQHPPSLLDLSVFSPIKMSSLILQEGEEERINNISSCFPHSSSSQHFQQRTDSSSIVVDSSEDQGIQAVTAMNSKRKDGDNGSCLSSAESKDPKKARVTKRRNNVVKEVKETETKKSRDDKKNQKKESQTETAPASGYVHVRARRGEATDSHSLAERVRRERISERLKLLQSLVPGCDKVTSKALMLDEIINYVQSLQQQVEFLSMKLASTSPMVYDLSGIDINSIVKQERLISNMESALPAFQQTSTVVSDITAPFSTVHNYPLTENSIAYLLQQGGPRPSVSYQDNVNLFWGGDEQRQRLFNQADFSRLCSFQ